MRIEETEEKNECFKTFYSYLYTKCFAKTPYCMLGPVGQTNN